MFHDAPPVIVPAVPMHRAVFDLDVVISFVRFRASEDRAVRMDADTNLRHRLFILSFLAFPFRECRQVAIQFGYLSFFTVAFAPATTANQAIPATSRSRPMPLPANVMPRPIAAPEAHRLPMTTGFFHLGGSCFTYGRIMK